MWPEDTWDGRCEETNYSGTEDGDIWRDAMMDSMAGRKDTQVNPLRLIPQVFFLLSMFSFWDIEPKIQTFLDLV